MKKISSIADLAKEVGTVRPEIELISKAIYKGTDCGAWVAHLTKGDRQGVCIGSIVEGADEGTTVHDLPFPFTPKEFWDAVAAVEAEAHEIWMSTHGCETCAEHWEEIEPEVGHLAIWEQGGVAVWKDCPACHGEGEVR